MADRATTELDSSTFRLRSCAQQSVRGTGRARALEKDLLERDDDARLGRSEVDSGL